MAYTREDLPYDKFDRQSIYEYSVLLEGDPLSSHIDVDAIDDPRKRRGSFGNAVEEYYFFIKPNNSPDPDFPEANLELKTTPLKTNKNDSISSKERLVITQIDYNEFLTATFETSHLCAKAKDILLITYMWEKDKNPIDYRIERASLWGLPEEDFEYFKKDWEIIRDKVLAGKAHEISSSDTVYLEACTKAADSSVRTSQPCSDIPAKPRAWALKASYMTAVSNQLRAQAIQREEAEKKLSLLELVRQRFEPYFGKTEKELAAEFGYTWNDSRRKPKNLCALITRRILGVEEGAKIAEFEKAGIQPKTLRLKKNGRPKEAVSFPAFDYFELEATDFEDSDFYQQLQQRYLFVLYRESEDEKDEYRLADVVFWQMPEEDLEEAKRCYEQMRENVRVGRADISVKSSENRCCHVRPHGQNAQDTNPQPHGAPVVKKCFWLNQGYLQEELKTE